MYSFTRRLSALMRAMGIRAATIPMAQASQNDTNISWSVASEAMPISQSQPPR